MTGETISNYTGSDQEVKRHVEALEAFIGDVDGKETVISTDENTCIDDGTIDAADAVTALNGLTAALAVRDALLREIASQCHNLPRSATADRIEKLARAALTAGERQ